MSRWIHIAAQSCHAHVDAVAVEWDALGFEQRALPRALGQRAVRAHDTVPRKVGVVVSVEHHSGEAGGAGRHVAVAAHEAERDRAYAREDRLCARAL